MKLRKLIAVATATVVASVMTVSAFAHEAFLMYTDNSWLWGCWNASEFPAGTVDVTADGTYTVFVDSTLPTAQVEDEDTGEMVGCQALGAQVFCVDIDGLANALNCGKDAEGYENCATGADKMAFAQAAGLDITDVTITTTNADGSTTDVAVNQDNIIFGDIEGNGKIRIEIYNAYGDTVNAPAVDTADIAFDEKIAVTFTVSGISGGDTTGGDDAGDNAGSDASGDVNAPTTDKQSPDTGVEGVAAVAGLAVLAAGAVLVSKKRK